MSNRQLLAEHGTGLCLMALGVGTGSFVISGAVVGAMALETYLKCANRGARRAAEKALKVLRENVPDAQDADIDVALSLLQRTQLNLDPTSLAAEIETTDAPGHILKTTFGKAYDDADPGVQTALSVTVTAALQSIRLDEAFDRVFVQDVVVSVLREQGLLSTKVDAFRDENRSEHAAIRADVKEILEIVRSDPKFREEVERQRKLVVALAERYLDATPSDFDAALAGLERALEVAAEERGRLPGNVSDAVEAIETRVRELNDLGEVDAAEAALWDELERAEAAQIRLIETGLRQVVLTRNVGRAVALEVKKWTLEGGGFEDLRSVFIGWYKSGRDKGLRFDLEVSIGLARACRDRAGSSDETGNALNDLGNALSTLGARESGTERLNQAVAAYRAALEERTRDRVPLDWAMTQNNLGTALWRLGERESGTERLNQAVAAYRAALEEWTPDRVPLDWAGTQMNLGWLDLAYFDKAGDVARLDAAERHAAVAREVYVEAGAEHYVAQVDKLIAQIAARRG